MGMNPRDEALDKLLQVHNLKGYITFDDIIDTSEDYSLSFQDTDWLSENIVLKNAIIYDSEAQASNRIYSDDDEFDDYSKSDYEEVYKRIVGINSSLEPYVERLRTIKPPQRGEFGSLKYQLFDGGWYVRENAKDRVIEMYLRMALKMALQRAETYDLDLEETIGYANEGLVKAAEKYDPDKHGSFQTYASRWIMQNMDRMQDTKSPLIHYSKKITDTYFAVYPLLKSEEFPLEISNLSNKLRDKLQNEYGLNNEQIKCVLLAGNVLVNFDQLVDDDIFAENPENDVAELYLEDCKRELLEQAVNDVLDTLTWREEKVVRLYFGFYTRKKKTLEEVSKEFNVSRERIRQILNKALRKMQHPTRAYKLKEYY